MNHTVKHRDGGTITLESYTRQKAISAYCSECEGWEGNVRDCTVKTCPLYPYRRKTYATSS